MKKKICGFSYSKNMANFEAFLQVISSSINLLFLKSGLSFFICSPTNLEMFIFCRLLWSFRYNIRDLQQREYYLSILVFFGCFVWWVFVLEQLFFRLLLAWQWFFAVLNTLRCLYRPYHPQSQISIVWQNHPPLQNHHCYHDRRRFFSYRLVCWLTRYLLYLPECELFYHSWAETLEDLLKECLLYLKIFFGVLKCIIK